MGEDAGSIVNAPEPELFDGCLAGQMLDDELLVFSQAWGVSFSQRPPLGRPRRCVAWIGF